MGPPGGVHRQPFGQGVPFGAHLAGTPPQRQGEKLTLGIFEDIVHRGTLGQQLRVFGTKSKCLLTLCYHLAQAQGDIYDAIFRLHMREGVVIVGLGNP